MIRAIAITAVVAGAALPMSASADVYSDCQAYSAGAAVGAYESCLRAHGINVPLPVSPGYNTPPLVPYVPPPSVRAAYPNSPPIQPGVPITAPPRTLDPGRPGKDDDTMDPGNRHKPLEGDGMTCDMSVSRGVWIVKPNTYGVNGRGICQGPVRHMVLQVTVRRAATMTDFGTVGRDSRGLPPWIVSESGYATVGAFKRACGIVIGWVSLTAESTRHKVIQGSVWSEPWTLPC